MVTEVLRRGRLFRDNRNLGVLYSLLLLLCGTIGATSMNAPTNRVSYAAFGLLLVMFVAGVAREHREVLREMPLWQPYDFVPACLLAVWLYGLILGFARHNTPRSVISNFAGMTLYSTYYVFVTARVKPVALLRCVLIAAAINACYMYGFFVWDKVARQLLNYGPPFFRSLEVRAYYSDTLALLLAPVMLAASHLLTAGSHKVGAPQRIERTAVRVVGVLYVCLFAYLQISLSKATLLCYVLLIPVVAFQFRDKIIDLIRTRTFVPLVVLFATGLLAVYPATHEFSAYMPSGFQTGNDIKLETQARIVRKVQSAELIRDLTLLGKGLGATVSSGYSRDPLGYGFEQNYLNLLHKFGIFAGLIFAAYVLMAYQIVLGVRGFKSRPFACGGFTLFGALVMAYGNPILMSPIIVTLQCMILYWFRPIAKVRRPRAEPDAEIALASL